MTSLPRSRAFGVFLALGLAACSAEAPVEDPGGGEAADAVVGGTETFERPEIGIVLRGNGLCTGTLVRPNVVLTAMHCTGIADDADVTSSPTPFTFEIRKSATERYRYKADRLHTITVGADLDGSQRWRKKDIALLRLTESVPATVARPAQMARTWPGLGANVGIYGYGCSDRATGADGRRPGTGTKRKKEYRWSLGLFLGFKDTQDVCQGDSGGPLLDTGRNAVFGVTSGYVGGDDAFGDVPAYYDALSVVVSRWTR